MHNQSLDIRSFLMHRLQSGTASGEEVMSQLQNFLELERQSRTPADDDSASVVNLVPNTGRHLRVV